MQVKSITVNRVTRSKYILIAVIVALAYWVIDSLAAAYLFQHEGFIRELTHPNPLELWIRGVFAVAPLFFARLYWQRRDAEEGIRLFMEAVEEAADGIQITDLSGRIIYSNKAIERIYGFTPEEYMGKHVNDMNADSTFASEMILPSIQKVGRWRGEVMVKHKDGHIFPIYLTASMIKGAQGNPIALVGIIRDITKQKRIERALMESEERYRTLFESATDAAFILDIEGERPGKILAANQEAADMHGYTLDELLRLHINDLDTPETAQETPARVRRLLQGERIRFEGEHRRKDGTVFPVEVIASVVEFGGHKYILALDRDITESKTAKKLSDALNQINTAITSTLDVSEIMQRVVSESAQALGSGTAGIALREEGYWVTKYVHGLPNLAVGSKIAEDEAVITQIAIETGKPVSIDDIYADKRVDQELMEKHGICAFMVVPIMLRGEAIGALSFSYYRAVTFTDEQIDFASKLGTSVSLALENARLYESEKEVADVLQEALLVMPEEIEGTDFSYLYRSATRTARVGGDFYDIFELEHGKVGIVIGDVSGKGIEAATLTALIKSTIRAHAYEDKSPAVVIAKTNEAVKRGANLAVFITVVFGVLDVESGEFTYCSAGHPRAVIKRKTGEVVFLETSSPVIGAFLGVCFLDDKATLARGDILVLYTDGVVEARYNSSFYGEEGIVEFFKNLKPIPTKEVPQAIYGDVTKFASGKLSDDVAILAISLDERDV